MSLHTIIITQWVGLGYPPQSFNCYKLKITFFFFYYCLLHHHNACATGVYYCKKAVGKPWTAKMKDRGKSVCLGNYSTEQEARDARVMAMRDRDMIQGQEVRERKGGGI